MCGRYVLTDTNQLNERFGVTVTRDIQPSYNIAPRQFQPVIRACHNTKELSLMRWGIPQHIGKETVKEIINTRSDKAFSPFWKTLVTTQRVLIPANGFYEWKPTPNGKIPYFISLPSRPLYAFAGIWKTWTDPKGATFDTYSIMTSAPNMDMKELHDRMPVILHQHDEDRWLDPASSPEELDEMMWTPPDGLLDIYEVSRAVNRVSISSEQLINPVHPYPSR